MYRQNKMSNTSIKLNKSYEGETLETKVQRLVANKEPIEGTVALTYTERKDGVKAEFDIRTDKWEIATDAMDLATKSEIAKRDNKAKVVDMNGKEKGTETGDGGSKETGGQSICGKIGG